MAGNYIPSRSSWPHGPWFLTHTGYERLVDRRRRTSGNENARSQQHDRLEDGLGTEEPADRFIQMP